MLAQYLMHCGFTVNGIDTDTTPPIKNKSSDGFPYRNMQKTPSGKTLKGCFDIDGLLMKRSRTLLK
jgi:hypothetical protein